MEGSAYALEDFAVSELVLVRNVNRKEPWWPAIVLDPIKEAPETIRRQMQPERLCVMFYGPPANKKRPRDFCWAKEGDVLPLIEHLEQLQSLYAGRKDRGSVAFQAAIEEVLLVERGFKAALQGASEDSLEGGDQQSDAPTCSSCGITLNQAELEHTEQHEGRCGNCQKLYENKNYCPVCNKVWYQTDKNMVGCDTCVFWVHTHCDALAAKAINSTSDEPYHCPQCREKTSTKSRLAALRKAEDEVRKAQPKKPRTAYNLFSVEIHKQYSVDNGLRIDFKDMARVVGETWRTLTAREKAPYEADARKESAQYEQERRKYEEKHKVWADLHHKAKASGLIKVENGAMPAPSTTVKAAAAEAAAVDDDSSGTSLKPAAKAVNADTAKKIIVMCNGYRGIFLLGLQRVICMCTDCCKKPEAEREFSCTQYEQHCGAGAAKKWKASLRIEPGCVPEVPQGSHPMQVGKWLDQQGIDVKPSARPSAAPAALPLLPAHKATEKLLAAVYAPWNDMDNGKHHPVKVRWAGDRCTVCDSDVDYDQDQLVSCDMCGITVHQSCYGVQELPGEDDMWLCRACELKDDSKPPQCCLCPIEGGALKPTTEPGLWCHATCLQWIPEVSVGDDRRMEPVTHIRSIQKERWELNCCICKQRVGAKIQCSSCYTAYHPLCARIAGLYMNMVDASDGQEDGAVRLISYCPKHCTPHPELAGVQVVRQGEEEESEDDTNGLWNGQPFRPLPTVTLPDLPAGCARAMSLKGWERGSHGTGMGHTTNKGFWIPEKPVALPQEEVLALPEPPKGRGAGGRPPKKHRAPAAPKAPRGPGRQPRAIKLEETDQESQDEEPPVAVQLIPLPEGVPEVLHVTCNGRSGLLLVRTQRVQHGESEISASKFEQVCGKGDAKKWKCSIWTEAKDGSQDMMMQEWLALHKLDRKQLAALAGNAQAAQVYEAYLHQTVQEVMEDLLADFDEPELEPAQDMSVKGEDKPEQDVAKLDVADAAPIKHEHHTNSLDEQQQQQQTSVRMTAASAEADPMQNGHPADLEARPQLSDLPLSGPAPLEAPDKTQGRSLSQQPLHEAADGLAGTRARSPAQGVVNGQPPWAQHGQLPSADPTAKGSLPVGHGTTMGSHHQGLQSGVQADTPMQEASTVHVGTGAAVKDEEVQHGSGVGFQEEDSPLVEVDVMDPVNAYVEIEKEPLAWQPTNVESRQAAVKMNVDGGAGHRQASPPARATSSELEAAPRRKRSRSQEDTPALNGDLKRHKSASMPRPDFGIEMPRDQPEAWVGQKCKVFWPDDAEWYDAVVRAYDRSNGKHNVWYSYDQQGEWIDLGAEIDGQQVCWVSCLPGSKPKHIQPKPEPPELKADPCEASQSVSCTDIALAQPTQETPDEQQQQQQQQSAVQGKAAVGQQVAIWWPDDHAWYHGRVQGFQTAKGEHLVHYEDNEVEWLNLGKEIVLWKDLPGRPITPIGRDIPADAVATAVAVAPPLVAETGMLALEAAAPAAAEPAAPAVARGSVPDTVPIVCNSSRAVFDVKRTCILLGEGRECTPTEFERLAGKGASKKWKASLRVDKGGGVPGPTMGDWLVDAGLDTAKAARPKAAPALHAARRQNVSRERFGNQAAKPQGKQAHRDGCMCIICKQARRVGKTWGGMSGMPGGPKWQGPMITGGGRQGQPVPRFGKRAFLHALPHLVCGPLQHKVWKLPESKAWSPDEWLVAKGHQVEEAAATPAAEPTPSVKLEGTTRRGSLIRQSSAPTPAPAATQDAAQAKAGAKAAGGKAVGDRKGLTLKERLQKCQQTEWQRITFGKSGIHGWGLIARAEMKQDSMVVEYRGDLLRPKMSDDRQKLYNRIGKDCYLFNVNDDVVIDATMSGAVGRFTNHCCAPSMYTKVLEVEGESRLVFFARTDIKPGQELTYDYRFKEEEGDDKVQCKCGAPNCRGTLN
ncbi:TPA: hypothetical protein ACH3X2_008711 [Trebouxia sp. C0005]